MYFDYLFGTYWEVLSSPMGTLTSQLISIPGHKRGNVILSMGTQLEVLQWYLWFYVRYCYFILESVVLDTVKHLFHGGLFFQCLRLPRFFSIKMFFLVSFHGSNFRVFEKNREICEKKITPWKIGVYSMFMLFESHFFKKCPSYLFILGTNTHFCGTFPKSEFCQSTFWLLGDNIWAEQHTCLTSDLWPLTSKLWPLTCNLWPPMPFRCPPRHA